MKHRLRPLILTVALGLYGSLALAGRPLVVDDANTNDKGKGHVEAWVTRADGASLFSVSPAYAVADGLEIGALLARESGSGGLRVSAAQVKWRITPSQEKGCNIAAVLGVTQARAGGASSNGSYLNALASCNRGEAGSYHANLGISKTNGGGDSVGSWGMAYERAFGGLTPHVEWFGAEGSKPTLQFCLRGQLTDSLQLDGSLGRSDGVTIYTLGVKFTF